MRARSLAHLSDLHFGRRPEDERAAAALCQKLLDERVDHVVITGDVTHRGRDAELDRFQQAFAPLFEQDRVTRLLGSRWLTLLADEAPRCDRVRPCLVLSSPFSAFS